MNTSTSTRIAAGVTATYLREITRRPAPTTEPAARRATLHRRPDRTRADDRPGPRRGHAPTHGSRRRADRVSTSPQPAIGTTGLAEGPAPASVGGFAR
jgi:hypothetical protein